MTKTLSEKEKNFISAIKLLYASKADTLCFHKFFFIKGEAIIVTGAIESNSYADLLKEIREYLEIYKDILLSFTIEKLDGGTLTTITLKD